MNEIKWIKIDVTLFDNRKIKAIRTLPEGDSIVVIWLQLLCLAGRVNDCGSVYITKEMPYTEQILANECGVPVSTIQLALKTFQSMGMVEIVEDIIYISNWEKYQAIEKMELIRRQNRDRQKKWYETHKKLPNVILTDNLTQPNATDIDIDIRDKNNKRFIKPSVKDIADYCNNNNYNIDAERFYDYYESKGWKVGKAPMKDWKAAVRMWSRNNKDQKPQSKVPDFTMPERYKNQRRQKDIEFDEIRKELGL